MSVLGIDNQEIDVNEDVHLADGVFEWCVRNLGRQVAAGNGDRAIQWAMIAGDVANSFCSSKLADENLESALRELGRGLPNVGQFERKGASSRPLRWLHVLSCAYETGGHTALCRRWIELDQSGDIHGVVLTFQEGSVVPKDLRDAVELRGGEFDLLDSSSLIERSMAIRRLASLADVVVLHTHMWEPLAAIAFAIPDGPPVFLLNHADHTYWTGGSVADLILNIRPSGEALCESYRGNSRSFRLPIPIPRPTVVRGDPLGGQLRGQLGIPATATVFLTIGAGYKYVPTKEMNFLKAVKSILEQTPGSFLIAVGPDSNDPLWSELAVRTGDHVIAVGVKKDIGPYIAAADVYLEGFPFGSLTALLEAVLAGLHPVLAPECCPLPYRSDDFALATLDVPKDTKHYVLLATELASQVAKKVTGSINLKDIALKTHCEPGWLSDLAGLRNLVIAGIKHDPKPLEMTNKLDDSVICYWANFSRGRQKDKNAFGYVFQRAMDEDLQPCVDVDMYQCLRRARSAGLNVASPIKSYLASVLLSILPAAMAKRAYFKK